MNQQAEKINIKERLDEILKKDNHLTSEQYVAFLTRFNYLRDSYERHTGSRAFLADEDMKELDAIIGFLQEARIITREQREKLWNMTNDIRNENIRYTETGTTQAEEQGNETESTGPCGGNI